MAAPLSLPGAEIWEIGAEKGLRRGLGLSETTAFRALRDFLEDPQSIAEFVVAATATNGD